MPIIIKTVLRNKWKNRIDQDRKITEFIDHLLRYCTQALLRQSTSLIIQVVIHRRTRRTKNVKSSLKIQTSSITFPSTYLYQLYYR